MAIDIPAPVAYGHSVLRSCSTAIRHPMGMKSKPEQQQLDVKNKRQKALV